MKSNDFYKMHEMSIFFILSLAIAWAFWIPMAIYRDFFITSLLLIGIGQTLGAFGPLISLLILEKLTKNKTLIKDLFRSNKEQKTNLIYYILSIALIPCVIAFANYINYIMNPVKELEIIRLDLLNQYGLAIILIMSAHFMGGLIGSPFLEEPGWRGFGMPRLQERFGKTIGSLLLGSYWWLWHVPLHILYNIEFPIITYFNMVALSFIADSLYNMSNKKIVIAMFYHSSLVIVNLYCYDITYNTTPDTLINVVILWSFVLIIRLIEKKNPGANI